ncbi:MAG TPA: hypothetical protein VGI20_02860 [Rhizomicrobium sp.]
MIAVLAGALALVLVLLLLGGFAGADVRSLAKGLRYTGAAALLLAAIGLAILDRVGLAVLAGSFAWGLLTGGRVWPVDALHGRRRAGASANEDSRREERAYRGANSAMSRDEALKLLGLEEGAGETDVISAHRRLILQTHPDRGGSSYLAAKINEARDVLLGR